MKMTSSKITKSQTDAAAKGEHISLSPFLVVAHKCLFIRLIYALFNGPSLELQSCIVALFK
jgi:hypothetical protein